MTSNRLDKQKSYMGNVASTDAYERILIARFNRGSDNRNFTVESSQDITVHREPVQEMARYRFVLLMLYSCAGNFITNQSVSNGISEVLASILETYYTDFQKPVLVQFSNDEDEGRNKQLDLFTETIVLCRKLIPIKFGQEYSSGIQPSFYNVIFVESYQTFLRIYKQFDPISFDYSGLYIIVYSNRRHEFALMQSIFSEMWRKKIISVIILASGPSEEVLIYSYLPYQPNVCGQPHPVLVANISDESPNIGVDLFPERLADLFGCPLNAGIHLLKPFTIDVDHRGETKFTGIEVSIVETVAQQHNFTINYVTPPDGIAWGSLRSKNSTGLMGLMQEELIDFGFGSIIITQERSFYLSSGKPHYTSLVVFAVPSGRQYNSFEKLYKPFSWKAWLWLASMYGGVAISVKILFGPQDIKVLRVFQVEKYKTPFLNTWGTFIGIPLKQMPTKNITYFMLTTWMFFGLLVRTLYLAGMFKNLHSGERIIPVRTLEEIENARLYYYIYEPSKRFFVDSPKVLKMIKQLAADEDTDQKMHQLSSGKLDGVLVLPLATVNYFNQHNIAQEYVNIATDIVATYSISIHYPKNTPYKHIFDNVVVNLQTSGILNYWREIFGENNHKRILQTSLMPIDFNAISGEFFIWAGSLVVCCVVFLIEVFWGRKRKSK